MRDPVDFRNDAMECLRMAEQAKAQVHKSLLVDMAQAWLLLAEQAARLRSAPAVNKPESHKRTN